jgi:ABC-2 type transport system ATP-binding protein
VTVRIESVEVGPVEDHEPAVEVRGLVKRFGDLEAVSDVSFSVSAGEVFAFLGPNGAGKSTTIKMLCTLALPTSGSATVAGFDVVTRPKAVRRHIGLVFQEQTLDDQLTANENLRFHAVLYRVPRNEVESRIRNVLDLVDLAHRGDDLVSTFSGGMARRLEIARALLHTPDVLFLDEPTIGLDPQTRALMWEDVLRMRRDNGVTVFMTTHYMDEAEYADRIAIIDHGRIVALDTPTNLKAAVGADSVDLQTANDPVAKAALTSAGYDVRTTTAGLTVMVTDGEAAVASLIAVAGVPVRHVHVHRPTLDDVFLGVTGREIRDQTGQARSTMQRAWSARHH